MQATFMQPSAASFNDTEVRLKDADREFLAGKTAEFLRQKSIKKLGSGKKSKIKTPVFNTSISINPERKTVAAQTQESIELAIKQLADIEILGLTVRRSAAEVAKLMRQRGYKMREKSARRIALNIGIELAA